MRFLLAALMCFVVLAQAATAQGLIRDAEIEQVLADLTAPLERAAGLAPGSTNIFIVNDREMNAFVTGGQNIFIHSGLIQRLPRADMLQAVIAHELGHITAGHITARSFEIAQAERNSAAGAVLGLIVGLAGAPGAGVAIASGAQGTAEGLLRAYTRDQEATADQLGARYMDLARIDPGAMLDTLDLFRGQDLLSTARQDEYAQSHPLSSTRIDLLSRRADNASSRGATVDPATEEAYRRMQAKFDGFLRGPSDALRRVEGRTDMAARIQRAVAMHRIPDLGAALREIDAALAIEPQNPWLHELKGQFLLEAGQAEAAVGPYRQAVTLRPDAPLLRAGYGRALLATGQNNAEALRQLSAAREGATGTPLSLRALAEAHARAGNTAQAALYTAERYALNREVEDALRFARRAAEGLPNGSPDWIRAQDLIAVLERL
ncbi:M48 family metalloprotease [Pontivivens insulae]|uniref:Beta-barrel assembly-enhancing protease n=1 Tax=Pontivivens insulae TaxID=1639689 RepID=A0A2R8ABK7_9RHOB|nr:M48 family metalloprotease [Pontivivens insulae]RED11369.1 putative Zn-dependent protease [Pontivivens insulae]SPF29458.1 Beta-barrel assembly-enhancing protease [Pontivivens insulae]